MKKILFITAILIGFLGSAQDSIVNKISLKGRVYNVVGGGSSPPFPDNAPIIEDNVDDTKTITIDASNITTGTNRTITMPDADVDLQTVDYITLSNPLDLDGLVISVNSKEDLINKVTDLSTPDNTQYPTTLAVSNELADRPTSLGTGRTNPVEYSDIYGQTLSDYNTDGAGSAGDLIIITDASPAEVVATATIAMDGWKMYDDQTADAATITLSDCDPGETLTVYINRASAPTLAGTGLTFNQLPNTTAFASATEMMIIFEVAYDGTTIDYYYVER